MEIDFLGLHSPKHITTDQIQTPSTPPFTHTDFEGFYAAMGGGVETTLSLCNTSFFDSKTDILSISEKKNSIHYKYNHGINTSRTQEQTNCLQDHVPIRPVFPYDLNECPTSTIIASENPTEVEAMRGSADVFANTTLQQQDNKVMYGDSGESRISTNGGSGYTPTVAMARRATLARFLEKRLHRLNQARTSHVTYGKTN